MSGAVNTGTHGSGLNVGNIASIVVEVSFVLASGQVKTFRKGKDRDFAGAVCAIGLLGLLVDVSFRVVKSFPLLKTRTVYEDFGCFAKALHGSQTGKSNQSKLTWFLSPSTPEIVAFSRDFLSGRERERTERRNAWTDPPPVVDSSHRAMTLPPDAFMSLQTETEFFLPMRLHTLCIERLRMIFAPSSLTQRGILADELKYISVIFCYVKGDSLWLSPCFQQFEDGSGFVAITLVVRGVSLSQSCSASLFSKVSSAFHDAISKWGRPHWGKRGIMEMLHWSRKAKEQSFPKLNSFLQLRQQLDPEGALLSPFFRTLLSIDDIGVPRL